jgi:Secretion system C-terminal sorting domain
VNKTLFYIIPLLLMPATAWLQSRSVARFSATGKLSSGAPTMSLTVSFNKNSGCLKLNTGLALYHGERRDGAFVLACATSAEAPVINIKFFPNPVSTYGKLISMTLLAQERQLAVSVLDATGRVLMQLQHTDEQIYNGLTIEMSGLPAGSYFLRVDGKTVHRVISFIKTN